MALYPAWLSIAIPHIRRAKILKEVTASGESYFIFSGMGMPHLLDKALPRSIEDVEANRSFSDLVIVVDSEGENVDCLRGEIELRFREYSTQRNIRLTVIVQDLCIESWLLGNKKMYSSGNQCPVLLNYRDFYDCKILDPEQMRSRPKNYPEGSVADFHYDYLRRIFREKKETYSKSRPGNANEEHYFEQLVSRSKLGDLKSFNTFLMWLKSVH